MPSLSLHTVSKSFPQSLAGLRDVSLSIDPGECVAILGPSGSGKSTLLRIIAGLDVPDSGTVSIDGRDVTRVPPHLRGVAFVPQKPALYPQMTVKELIEEFGIRNSEFGMKKSTITPQRAIEILELSEHSKKLPHQLSGGEKQRVALARALVSGAKLWLLDEPFAPLDPPFRAEFRHRLHLITRESAPTILFVTHDPVDAWALGRRIGVLGDGRLQAFGTPEDLAARPGNRFVAFCLGRFVFTDGTLADGQFASDDGSVAGPGPVGMCGRVTLGLRATDVTATEPSGATLSIRGMTASGAIPDGSGWTLTLTNNRTRLEAHWPTGQPVPMGETRNWFCPLERCEWFEAESGRRM